VSMQYIREAYGVPAKRGGRVEYSGTGSRALQGTITGAKGAHLRIRLDGYKHSHSFHPTWKLRYLEQEKDTPHGKA